MWQSRIVHDRAGRVGVGGAEALLFKDRLEASGYTALEGGGW
jgi:hypothetical protein